MSYYNGAGREFPLPERPLEPADCWVGEAKEEPGDPSDQTLRAFAEENYKEFVEYIIGYDQSLLFDFAYQNKLDFRKFCGGRV